MNLQDAALFLGWLATTVVVVGLFEKWSKR